MSILAVILAALDVTAFTALLYSHRHPGEPR